MITRRTVLAILATSPLSLSTAKVFSARIDLSFDTETFAAAQADRTLTTTISSGMQCLEWVYGGQYYAETRDSIALDENERIKLSVLNDTGKSQRIGFSGLPYQLSANRQEKGQLAMAGNGEFIVPAGHSIELDVLADNFDGALLFCSSANISRDVVVRPCDLPHRLYSA